jgi:choline-sulfatase
MKKHPNVLFLMSDEHRFDVSGFHGNQVVRTPNLDRLAKDAVVFDNAYTPSPICVPGRQAMMTGKFPRDCGSEKFKSDIPPGSMTWARRFAQHGYSAVCCGKLHHTGPDQMQGWTKRPFGDMELSPWAIEDTVQPQFETNRDLKDWKKWSDTKECLRAGVGKGRYQIFDEQATAAALSVLDNHFLDPMYDRPSPQQPLLLKVSLLHPHYPYFADEELFRYYLNRVEAFIDEPVFDHPFLSRRQVKSSEGAEKRDLIRATAAYYAMVEKLDQHFGEVLNKIESIGENLDDWIIVYTTDHGEMLGEHGVWEKQKFFEGSARVPFFIRYPKAFSAKRVEENVNLCDLFATFCELCHLEPPKEENASRSLVPLMNGDNEDWLSQQHNETVSQFGGTNVMIKRNALKYQYYGEEMPEVLFDLERDPKETSNLINDPTYKDALPAFRTRLKELGF